MARKFLDERRKPFLTGFEILEDGETAKAHGYEMLVKARLGVAGEINRNRRLYPLEYYRREIERLSRRVEANEGIGEADHPEGNKSPSIPDQAVLWTSVSMEGREAWGTGKILSTRKGQDAAAIIRGGAKMGVSSRAWASVTERVMDESDPDWATNKDHKGVRYERVDDDLDLRIFDLVMDPGFATAGITQYREDALPGETTQEDDMATDTNAEALAKAEARVKELEAEKAKLAESIEAKAKALTEEFEKKLTEAKKAAELPEAQRALLSRLAAIPAEKMNAALTIAEGKAPEPPDPKVVDAERSAVALATAIESLKADNAALKARIDEREAADKAAESRRVLEAHVRQATEGKPNQAELMKFVLDRADTVEKADAELKATLDLAEKHAASKAALEEAAGAGPGNGKPKGVRFESENTYGRPEADQRNDNIENVLDNLIRKAGGKTAPAAPKGN